MKKRDTLSMFYLGIVITFMGVCEYVSYKGQGYFTFRGARVSGRSALNSSIGFTVTGLILFILSSKVILSDLDQYKSSLIQTFKIIIISIFALVTPLAILYGLLRVFHFL